MSIKITLVDDQTLIREGIKSLFSLTDEIEVIAECSDGVEVLQSIENTPPDVIMLDLSMPKMGGVDVLKELQRQQIDIPVLVLTTFDDHELILQSISAGAKGFLLKDVSLETLIDAITQVHQGGRFLLPAVTEKLLEQSGGSELNKASVEGIEALSARELDVLRLIAGGYSNKEIASALHKSEGTIKNHVSNILSKMGVRDRTRAVLLALEHGLLSK
ncbi:response regulator transcription factor [Pleionea litopenaei]|uniref:Response regulator transcription factor n=1 Tax=Pleionea litopenaei TaxID=3070815 RepID=A0AA51X570_9GAMM|nr:response regulator transcription factor [Pleionea sp. HL-JVS1]WMS85552.1 response regulator transcription factor [Pleionea sp. HL-JVS1]